MKIINVLTLVLVIVGAVNWGLVGAVDFDLVAALFGPGALLSRAVYIVVAASGLFQLSTLFAARSAV